MYHDVSYDLARCALSHSALDNVNIENFQLQQNKSKEKYYNNENLSKIKNCYHDRKIYSHPEEFCRTMWSTSFVLFANMPPHVMQAKIFSLV